MKPIFAPVLSLAVAAAMLGGSLAASSSSASSSSSSSSSTSSSTSGSETNGVEQVLSTLMEGQYPELAMTAEMKGESVEPGAATTVEITLSNEGDKTLVYSQGSYTMENPSALLMEVEGLQPVMSKDQLEAVTDDTSRRNMDPILLEPGEEKVFEMEVLAIEPNAGFDERTYTLYTVDDEYIADLEWEELYELYPDLVKAEAGTYTGHAYFTYYVLQDGETASDTQTPTGYGLTDFMVIVAE